MQIHLHIVHPYILIISNTAQTAARRQNKAKWLQVVVTPPLSTIQHIVDEINLAHVDRQFYPLLTAQSFCIPGWLPSTPWKAMWVNWKILSILSTQKSQLTCGANRSPKHPVDHCSQHKLESPDAIVMLISCLSSWWRAMNISRTYTNWLKHVFTLNTLRYYPSNGKKSIPNSGIVPDLIKRCTLLCTKRTTDCEDWICHFAN